MRFSSRLLRTKQNTASRPLIPLAVASLSIISLYPTAFSEAAPDSGAPTTPAAPVPAKISDTRTLRALSATNVSATQAANIPASQPLSDSALMPTPSSMRLLAQADTTTTTTKGPTNGSGGTTTTTTTTVPAPATTPGAAPVGTSPVGPPTDGRERGGFRRGRGGFGGGFGGTQGGGGEESEMMRIEGDKVSLQFPNNTITDILGIYERLTGRTLVKDTNIFEGQPISLVTPTPVEKEEAIKLIESSMLTNGYAIINGADGKSARVLPTRAKDSKELQFSQGVPFFQSAKDIPNTEGLVSYFMKLDHLDPGAAAQILSNHVGLNVYGRMTPTSTPPGLLITESGLIVRQLIAIKDVIDQPDTSNALITKFIPLKYADSAVVAQIIQATLDAQAQDKEQRGVETIRGSGPVNSRATPGPPGAPVVPVAAAAANPNAIRAGANTAIKKPQAKSQVVADTRLNQLLVVAEPEDYAYVISLISEFDKPVEVPVPYERALKNVFSMDVLSVLADLLKDTGKAGTQLPGGGTVSGGNQQSLVSTSNNLLTGQSSTNQRGGSFNTNAAASAAASGGSTSTASSTPDLLTEATQNNAPVSVLVNKTRVIADPLANTIIVIGPKEDQDKVNQLLDKLDQKPAQVYLATIIGQLALSNNFNAGIDYLQKLNAGSNGVATSFLQATDIAANHNVADMTTNNITSTVAPLAGFNLYGQVTHNLGTFVNALETLTDFKVLSRPAVFALNNRRAVILSGQQIPVPTQSLTVANTVASNNTGNVTTTIDYKSVVLKLEVIPLINPDGDITLKIAQTNDTVSGNQVVAQNNVPIVSTEQLITTATVPSGNTVVLGGLISETTNFVSAGVPVLHTIPVIGKFFENNTKTKSRNELMIFIQPTVVNTNAQGRRASYAEDIRGDIGADAAKTFPEKVWPKAIPVENPAPVQPQKRQGWLQRITGPSTTTTTFTPTTQDSAVVPSSARSTDNR